jgi:molecular chaperone DnaK
MQKEAEIHAEEDKKKKENIEIKNQADAVVFTTEKLLKESGEKMKEEDKKELESKLEELKKIKDGDQYEEMKKKMEELNDIAQKIGAAMYQNQGPNPADPTQAGTEANPGEGGPSDSGDKGPESSDDNVVEGEVEEK